MSIFGKRRVNEAQPSLAQSFKAAEKAPKNTIVFVTDSFSKDSGGRTQSIFQRARLFGELGYNCIICTSNYKLDYASIFATLRKRFMVSNVSFDNPYEFLCEGTYYEPKNIPVVEGIDFLELDSASDPEDRKVSGTKDGLVYDILLRKNGSCKQVTILREGVPIEIRYYNRGARLVRREFCESDAGDKPIHISYDPKDGRPFLEVAKNAASRTIMIRWMRKNGSVQVFNSWDEVRDAWFAHIAKTHPGAIFFSEFHSYDKSIVSNPLAGNLPCVAMIHSTFMSRPYTYGTPCNKYLKPVFEKTGLYRKIVCITSQEHAHVGNYFGASSNTCVISSNPATGASQPHDVVRTPHSIVICNRLVPLKRIEDTVRAMARVRASVADATMRIYGTGESTDSISALIEELGLAECITLEGYTDEPLKALASGSITLATSRYEGLGHSIIESLSVGTPVIAYDYLYGPRDLIQDGVNGRIVPDGDIDALADAIIEVFSADAKLQAMSEAAPKLTSMIDPEGIKDGWKKLLDDVCADAQRDARAGGFFVSSLISVDRNEKLESDDAKTWQLECTVSVAQQTFCDNADYDFYLRYTESKRIDLSEELFVKGEAQNMGAGLYKLAFEVSFPRDAFDVLIEGAEKFEIEVESRGWKQFLRLP